jgi:hypothetical protein
MGQTPEKPKNTSKNTLFPLTNVFESRIVNGGGFVFTRINTGFYQRSRIQQVS